MPSMPTQIKVLYFVVELPPAGIDMLGTTKVPVTFRTVPCQCVGPHVQGGWKMKLTVGSKAVRPNQSATMGVANNASATNVFESMAERASNSWEWEGVRSTDEDLSLSGSYTSR